MQGLLVYGVQSTLWANGQTERVNSIRSETRSGSICCLRSLLIDMYSAAELRARGRECYGWIEIWCFTRRTRPYRRTSELKPRQYLRICSPAELYICAAQCWIFDMCDKGFFAHSAFWPIAVVHYSPECALPSWAVSSRSCTRTCASTHWKNVSPRRAHSFISRSSQVSSCMLFILSQEAKQRLQLIGKSGREDNISVMTLHIALNCFIGKMIVLVQFE